MESLQPVEEMEVEDSRSPSLHHLHPLGLGSNSMQLLTVPGEQGTPNPPQPQHLPPLSKDAKFLRRYSCNPQGKGVGGVGIPHANVQSSSSPGMMRRSSLAAIKWGVLARRISMRDQMPEDPTKAIEEVNTQVAILRDLLIHIGQSNRDGPELREKIRRIRRNCIESCRHAVQIILTQIHNDIADGIPLDFSPQLVLLFLCTQLLHKELKKCRRLVVKVPMDMSSYYADATRPGPSNVFASALSQIILCRQINPDFNQEEICSIEKDTDEISNLLDDMQEFMPMNDSQQSGNVTEELYAGRRGRRRRMLSSLCDLESLCCISKARRLSGF